MDNIIKFIGKIISLFYPLPFSQKVSKLLNKIYSASIIDAFGKVGRNFYAERRIKLFNAQHITLGDSIHIYPHAILATHYNIQGHGSISIGDRTVIGECCHLTSASSITIGKNVLFGRRVTITDNAHGQTTYQEMKYTPY